MNAMEARAISYNNIPKLVYSYFSDAVSHINGEIKNAAKEGKFVAGTKIVLPNNIIGEVVNRLVTHYQQQGYKVSVVNLLTTVTFTISWKNE